MVLLTVRIARRWSDRAVYLADPVAPDGFEELIFSFEGHYRRTEIQGDVTRPDILKRSYAVGCKTVGVNCLRLSNLSMVA